MYPTISILVAVRNEEAVIERCLQALDALTYPKTCLQILIGNDDSTDKTLELVQAFVAGKAHFTLCNITQKVGKQAGKANVLAQLSQKATSDFWFTTDADVAVSPTWVEDVLLAFDSPTVGVVSHFTWIETTDIFTTCQALEWTHGLAIFAGLSHWGIAVTAQGNNMAVRREAYEATGGYEALPFSVTEDFQLFWAIVRKGFAFRHVASKRGIVTSLPAPTWDSLFRQRRRWMVGAMELGFFWQVFLWSRALLFPVLVALFFFLPAVVLSLACLVWIANFLTLWGVLGAVGKRRSLWYFPFFLLYQEVLLLGTIAYFFLQKRVKWKGREF